MSEKQPKNGKPPWRVYVSNRSLAAQEEARKYPDQWIAWSADGTRIVAHHADPLEAIKLVKAAGLDTEDVVMAFEPPAGEEDVAYL
jgi:hypothetical protein